MAIATPGLELLVKDCTKWMCRMARATILQTVSVFRDWKE